MNKRTDKLEMDEAAATDSNKEWEIICTGIVYRQPVIAPEVPEWRTTFQRLKDEYHDKVGTNIKYPEHLWNVEVEKEVQADEDGDDMLTSKSEKISVKKDEGDDNEVFPLFLIEFSIVNQILIFLL